MSETVNYRMYLDAFGRIRAYEPVDGTKYALITELYYGKLPGKHTATLSHDRLTAEMMRPATPPSPSAVGNETP